MKTALQTVVKPQRSGTLFIIHQLVHCIRLRYSVTDVLFQWRKISQSIFLFDYIDVFTLIISSNYSSGIQSHLDLKVKFAWFVSHYFPMMKSPACISLQPWRRMSFLYLSMLYMWVFILSFFFVDFTLTLLPDFTLSLLPDFTLSLVPDFTLSLLHHR